MVIDFHSHILPKVDHGSHSSEESKNQLSLVSKSGVDVIVATSHFYPNAHKVEDFVSRVNGALEKVATFKDSYGNTNICVGAEVLVCEGMDRMEGLEKLKLRGTDVILLEMPFSGGWSKTLIETVGNIMDNGYNVVLAHIDRYIDRYKDYIDEMISMGAKAQLNADSIAGFFSRRKVIKYIEKGDVYAFGSDLHGADEKLYKMFVDIEKHIGRDNYEEVMKKTERLIQNALVINKQNQPFVSL